MRKINETRRARVESAFHSVDIDGGDVFVPEGPCLVEFQGVAMALVIGGQPGNPIAKIPIGKFNAMLDQRKVVYLSW